MSARLTELLRQLDLQVRKEDGLLSELAEDGDAPLARFEAARTLAKSRPKDGTLSLLTRVVGLDFARQNPAAVQTLIGNYWCQYRSLDDFLIGHGTELARELFELARDRLGNGRVDSGIATHKWARREWQAILGGLSAHGIHLAEGLGKIAVSTAAIGRWDGSPPSATRRAIEYMERSVKLGNSGPEALAYLSELHEQFFIATSNEASINRAIELATRSNDTLALRRCLLLAGLAGRRPAMELFELARRLRSAPGRTAVDFVQRDVLSAVVSAYVLSSIDPGELDLLVPQGVLNSLRRAPSETATRLSGILLHELTELQARCESETGRRNIVGQQLLVATLEVASSRDRTEQRVARLQAEARRLVSLIPDDRHAAWRAAAADAELGLARRDMSAVHTARDVLLTVSEQNHGWAAPIATAAEMLHRAGETLRSSHAKQQSRELWQSLAERVAAGTEYQRETLGGRSGVFALEDVRGDLRTQLVFKPVASIETGEAERQRLDRLRSTIADKNLGARFSVPRPLEIVATHEATWLVIKRSSGNVLSELPNREQVQRLDDVIDLLSLCTPVDNKRTGWATVRKLTTPGLRKLLPTTADDFRDRLRQAMPDAPAVQRRDGNPNNWLVDVSGRIVAIDLEASQPVPLGFDLAQLIEDRGMLPPDAAGFEIRRAAMRRYLNAMSVASDVARPEALYDWCALTRAVWSATYPLTRRVDARHSRRLIRFLATESPDAVVSELAAELAAIFGSDRGEVLSPVDVKLSRRMARAMRHSAPERLPMDSHGWVALAALSDRLGVPIEQLIQVASHPEEPRFAISGGLIRATYGHSRPIEYFDRKGGPLPSTVFHGTPWASLSSIAANGIEPMGRNLVHLATDESEALEVARRKGSPVLLRVAADQCRGIIRLAPGTWGARHVPSQAVSIHEPTVHELLPVEHFR